jgi:hypothetical protein
MHSWQTNDSLADAYLLKLTPPLRKDKINNTNYFVSLTTSNNTKLQSMTLLTWVIFFENFHFFKRCYFLGQPSLAWLSLAKPSLA